MSFIQKTEDACCRQQAEVSLQVQTLTLRLEVLQLCLYSVIASGKTNYLMCRIPRFHREATCRMCNYLRIN